MARIISFIATEEGARRFKEKTGSLFKEALLVTIDLDAEACLEANGRSYKSIWDYIEPKDLKDVDEKADSLAMTWYKPFDEAFSFQNEPLGPYVRWDIEFFFREAETAAITVTRILDAEKPDTVIFDGDEKKTPLLREDKESCANGTLNAVIAYEALKRQIVLYPVSKHPHIQFIYSLAYYLSKLGIRQAPAIAYQWDLELFFTLPARMIKAAISCIRSLLGPKEGKDGKACPELPPAGKCVLFIGGTGIDFDRTTKIANNLEQRHPDLIAFVMGRPTRTTEDKATYPKHWLWPRQLGLMPVSEKREWAEFQRQLHKAFSVYYRQLCRNSSGPVLGNPFFKRYLEYFLGLHNIAWARHIVYRALDMLKPRAVIVRWPMERLTRVFRQAIDISGSNTQILHIPHAPGMPYREVQLKDYALASIDKIASGGEITNLIFEEKKMPPEKLILTGFQEYDRFSNIVPADSAKGLLAKSGKIRILVATGGYLGTIPLEWDTRAHRKTLDLIVSLPVDMPNVHIIFKTHPRFNYARLMKYICEKNANHSCEFCPTQVPLSDLLPTIDILMVVNSGTTAAIEGAIFKKPVILVLTARSPYTKEEIVSAKWDGAECVYRDSDIAPTIKKILGNADFRQRLIDREQVFINRYVYKLDGHATERITDLIVSSAEGNR
ncbi:MAG: hypothetical protein HQ558_04670 [Candidatus Omnitrophica bacterium]|nr:hypothetical protein [Candidatus Omnitrophota bacterium]